MGLRLPDFNNSGAELESLTVGFSAEERVGMTSAMITVPYVVAMIAVIVAVDTLIFRNFFWERLMVNIGLVLVFAAFYLRFFKRV
jgi:hypothetical protein